MSKALRICRLGLAKYGPVLELQEFLATRRRAQEIEDTLLVVEHPPVYTVGKRRTTHNILADEETLRNIGAEVFHIERGGDVTFHGPGQAVLYPIVNLHSLKVGARRYVETLEDIMIKTAAKYGIDARGRVPLQTGVWVGERKLGAVGVRISAGVTTHGLALNIYPRLEYFDHIVPCGIADKEVTSLQKECPGKKIHFEDVVSFLVSNFRSHLGYSHVRDHVPKEAL